MANENLGQTLDELLAFVDDRLDRRTLADGLQIVLSVTRRLTREEIDHLFLLDQIAGVQAEKCGLRLPPLPVCDHPSGSHLPHTHLAYQHGPGLRLSPTDSWQAEMRAIRTVAKSMAETASFCRRP